MARSTWVAHEFEWEKLLKCQLKGKASRKLAMDRILIILKKENGPRASSALTLGLNTIILKHVFWYTYMQQISGERLQDHWSSGFPLKTKFENLVCKISQKVFKLEPSYLVYWLGLMTR